MANNIYFFVGVFLKIYLAFAFDLVYFAFCWWAENGYCFPKIAILISHVVIARQSTNQQLCSSYKQELKWKIAAYQISWQTPYKFLKFQIWKYSSTSFLCPAVLTCWLTASWILEEVGAPMSGADWRLAPAPGWKVAPTPGWKVAPAGCRVAPPVYSPSAVILWGGTWTSVFGPV